MTWQPYHIVFRLCSPMHIGSGSVGNIQRTRTYITGRVLWGALTMRITRNNHSCGSLSESAYDTTGKRIHELIACTYFYPATFTDGVYKILWPWDKPDDFKRRMIRSYASTALDYPMQSAAEALLHESEFISPYTLDTGEPVFLTGYIFVDNKCDVEWNCALQKLQFGGDHCYGWGDVKLQKCEEICGKDLFDGKADFKVVNDKPVIQLTQSSEHLLAHTKAGGVNAQGTIEPLVGRTWLGNGRAGQYVEFSEVCFTPGSKISDPFEFNIGTYGVWYPITSQS